VKNPFNIGDVKLYSIIVGPSDVAAFDSGIVHEVYSTFCLARDAEWSTRLFVLDMKETDEEGIGTFIEIYHRSPAAVNTQVDFYATLQEVNGHEVICTFTAKCGNRIIAEGRTGQKILKKEKVDRLMASINS
jgi:predicted thioesterase